MRKAAREKMGTEGEDVVADPSGGLKLRMPMRMGIGTVKAAAWHVRLQDFHPANNHPTNLRLPVVKPDTFVAETGWCCSAADGERMVHSTGWMSCSAGHELASA